MTDLTNIFLCGFMGSGKSTMGKKLAAIMGFSFRDLDELIEKKYGKSIPAIFASEGETTFRAMETSSLADVMKEGGNKVISLGGGTVCFNNNLELIKANGKLIYLQLPAKVLAQRITKGKQDRPLLQNRSGEELLAFIDGLLEERKKFYEQADLIVNALNLSPQVLHQKIIELR